MVIEGVDLSDAEDRGMVPRGAYLSDAKDKGMVPGRVDLSDAEDKGKFIIYRGQRHGSRGSMSDMISVLHQSVVINTKGGDC